MLESRTISISINRNWKEVYEAVWRPEDFPKWASGLSRSSLIRDGELWKAEGPEGAVRIRFTAHNAFGIMDHYVYVGTRKVMPYATIGVLSRTRARKPRKPIPLSIAQVSMIVQPVPRKIAVAQIRCFAKSPAVSMKTHGTWLVEFTRHRNISAHDVSARRSKCCLHTSSAF